jgi:TPR repeat protein
MIRGRERGRTLRSAVLFAWGGVALFACSRASSVPPGSTALADASNRVSLASGASASRDPPPLDACRVVGSRQPYLVRWTPAQQEVLQSAMRAGIAVVASDDCHGLHVLPRCHARGRYGYLGATPEAHRLDLSTDEELRVNAPVAEAAGADAGEHAVHFDLSVVGHRATARALLSPGELTGDCQGATHFVTAATVGAAVLPAPGRGASGAAVVASACAAAHAADGDAPLGCRTLLEVSISPIAELGELISFDQAPAGAVLPIGTCPASMVVSGHRCVRPPVSEPFLCAFGDGAACRAQCDRGDANSCDVLAFMLLHAQGASKDVALATTMYARSCDQGDAIACDNLGGLYYGAEGVPKDAEKAAALFDRACALGSADACGNLGTLLRAGEGIVADEARGSVLAQRACDGGAVGACMQLAMRQLGSAAEGAPARGLATLEDLCDGDTGPACFQLGRLHFLGQNVPESRAHAATLFDKACRTGDNKGCVMLGLQYRQADGVARDDALATRLMGQACSRGDAEGCHNLGVAYENGKGVDRDPAHAMRLYDQACTSGEGRACTFLGDLLRDGTGVPKDGTRARASYARACELGEKDACKKTP